MFSLQHETVVSTEVFTGIGFGHDVILSQEHLPWKVMGLERCLTIRGGGSCTEVGRNPAASHPADVAVTLPVDFAFWAVSRLWGFCCGPSPGCLLA